MEQDRGEAEKVVSISRRDRILLHLEGYAPAAHEQSALFEQTQEGIARVLGKVVSNISRPLKGLQEEGLVESATRRVEGEARRRRRVYWLSSTGRQYADELRSALLQREVEVQTLEGEVQIARLGEVNRLLGVNLPLPSLLALLSSERKGPTAAPRSKVHQRFMPSLPTHFVGRSEILAELTDWCMEGSESCFVVQGMGGMGKTALARKFADQEEGRRPLLWFTATRWDTPESFLTPLGQIMADLGQPLLQGMLTSAGEVLSRLAEFLELIVTRFQGTPQPLVVLDDIHLLQGPLARFLVDLLLLMSNRGGVRWLLLGRHSQPLTGLKGKTSMRNLQLQGLSEQEVADLVPDEQDFDRTDLWERTGGHPLAIQMLATIPGMDIADDLIEFVQNQILTDLDEQERRLVEVAALSWSPAQPADLMVENHLRMQQINSLVQKGLLIRHEEGLISLHELVRSQLVTELPAGEQVSIHKLLYRRYRTEEHDDGILRCIHHLIGSEQRPAAMKLVDRWGTELVDRGRTELFHVLDPICDDPVEKKTAGAFLVQARVHLMWDDVERSGERLEAVEGVGVGQGMKVALLGLRARLARARDDFSEMESVQEELLSSGGRTASVSTAEAHNELGLMARLQGDVDRARSHYLESIKQFEQLDSEGHLPRGSPGATKPMANLAALQRERGEIDAALKTIRGALELAERRRDDVARARVLFHYARLSKEVGEDPLEYLDKARNIFTRIGDRFALCQVLIELSQVHRDRGESRASDATARQARELAEKINSSFLLAEAAKLS